MSCQMRLYSTYACGIRTSHLHPGVVLSPIELMRYSETISLTAKAYYRCLCAYHRHDFDLAAIARSRGPPGHLGAFGALRCSELCVAGHAPSFSKSPMPEQRSTNSCWGFVMMLGVEGFQKSLLYLSVQNIHALGNFLSVQHRQQSIVHIPLPRFHQYERK